MLHTYDKQYNVTRSSRYGILENFIIHYYNCYSTYCFISLRLRVSLRVTIRESLKKKDKKKNKEDKKKKERERETSAERKLQYNDVMRITSFSSP